MALTTTEEALVRQLLAEQAELLNLASNEATIISKLGATKKNIGQLTAAVSVNDTDIMPVRQGTSDRSMTAALLKNYTVGNLSTDYLNKTTTSAQTVAGQVTFNQNIGVGVVPSAWSVARAIEISNGGFLASAGGALGVLANGFFNGTSYIYKINGFATNYLANSSGRHEWYTAPSGTAGNVISFTQSMTLNESGRLLLNTASAPAYSSIMRMNGGLEIHNSQQLNVAPDNANPYEIVNRANGGFDFYPTGATLGARLDSSGTLTVTGNVISNGVNVRAGAAKAFVCFDGTGTPTIKNSFNVSSITRLGTGYYRVNFTSAQPNVNYSVAGACGQGGTGGPVVLRVATFSTGAGAKNVSYVDVVTGEAGANADNAEINVVIFGA